MNKSRLSTIYHPFSILQEKDKPMLIIENGLYSDWNYNRI